MNPAPPLELDGFRLEPCASHPVPGYLILRAPVPAPALGQLDAATAARTGQLLSLVAEAIESVVGAERMYVLSFCELDRNLHFHLFPRTPWLQAAWQRETGEPDGPPDGPRLFEWVRRTCLPGFRIPSGVLDADAAWVRIRARLAEA